VSRFRKKAIHVSRLDPFQTHYQLITLIVDDPFQGKISLLVLQLTINNFSPISGVTINNLSQRDIQTQPLLLHGLLVFVKLLSP
jgi:hypothetical protein